MKLLDFVGIYGTILAPVGAVIVVEHFAQQLGLRRAGTDETEAPFNLSFLLAWALPVAVALWLYAARGVAPFFLPLPAWIASGVLYVVLSRLLRARVDRAAETAA
jgi:purine-cytosine permease-like protein